MPPSSSRQFSSGKDVKGLNAQVELQGARGQQMVACLLESSVGASLPAVLRVLQWKCDSRKVVHNILLQQVVSPCVDTPATVGVQDLSSVKNLDLTKPMCWALAAAEGPVRVES